MLKAKKNLIITVILAMASLGGLSALFFQAEPESGMPTEPEQNTEIKECEKDSDCTLSYCDCKCRPLSLSDEDEPPCGIDCEREFYVSGCECKDNKCSEITISPTEPLKIAAFNIQIFGKSKREKEDVMEVLTKIAQEFDIMLIQELRDSKEATTPYYLQRINEAVGYPKYAFQRSERVGRSSSKEAYAYFYNTDKVEFIEGSAYLYDDSDDVFEREPYVASFKSGNFDFTLVGIHIKPSDAYSEIANLEDVYHSVRKKNPGEFDTIFMGDFNADGTYFNENDNRNPFKSPGRHWVITNDMDTMTKTDWTYDRIVLMDSTFFSEYDRGSGTKNGNAGVFYFDKEYGITDNQLVWDISDHYPVYAEFKTYFSDDD